MYLNFATLSSILQLRRSFLSRIKGLTCRHNFANFSSHLADYDNSFANNFQLHLVRGQQAVLKLGARNRVGIGLSCRTAWLRRLAELIPWN
jgi:hypothetical protein